MTTIDKLNFIISYFQGAFDAYMEGKEKSHEQTAIELAYLLTKNTFKKQPIFRYVLDSFDEWYLKLL